MDFLPSEHFLRIPKSLFYKKESPVCDTFKTISCKMLPDDFYTSLIDWAGESIFFVENNSIVAYNLHTKSQMQIYSHDKGSVCSMKAIKQSNSLVIGDSIGNLTFVDFSTLKSITRECHERRISALDVMGDKILTGSGDKTCMIVDSRVKGRQKMYKNHILEVCGVSVNREDRYFCSGGNDNIISVVDFRNEALPLVKLEGHKAAIRALSWSPLHSTKFASGGGTLDKTIKSWDISLNTPLVQSISFDSQICNVKWLNNNKILSSFGYSDNDIRLLKNLKVEKRYIGHKNRVIHFAVDDREEHFVSGSADLDIKIYEIESKFREDIEFR